MLRAGREARRRAIPIVLDPVGAGATRARTELSLELLEHVRPSVLRANASEVRALALAEASTKGVDSTADAVASMDAARALVARFGCVVSVSGEVDVIVGQSATGRVRNGHPLMGRVTGMGCTASALTAAFAAVESSSFDAAVGAMVVNGVAGEIAAERSAGPGSFQMQFLDALYSLDAEQAGARARMEMT
jgi:hydroxyethylthiazole kinase